MFVHVCIHGLRTKDIFELFSERFVVTVINMCKYTNYMYINTHTYTYIYVDIYTHILKCFYTYAYMDCAPRVLSSCSLSDLLLH